MGKRLHKSWLALAFFALAACVREDLGQAAYSLDQCRRVAVIDAATGLAIRGAEDFAPDFANGRLFFTAYDRRAVERAARKGREALPGGGVYTVALADFFEPGATSVRAATLAVLSDITGGLHPHGLSYDPKTDEIAFINRAYRYTGRKWEMTPQLHRIGAGGEIFVGDAGAAPCAANDVLIDGERTWTSFDHAYCNWRAGVEDIFGQKRSGVADYEGTPLFMGASFANGLERLSGDKIIMAATRENALLILQENANGLEEVKRIKTPGGPDNITIAYDGAVIAAVHPSLLRLAFNRKFGLGKAPSRIVKVTPASHGVAILFDDRKGSLFSAATVAIETIDGLIAGSVTDKGVLVCRRDT